MKHGHLLMLGAVCTALLLVYLPAALAEEGLPGFLPREAFLPDSDFPMSRAPVTPEEIDEAAQTAVDYRPPGS